MLVWIFFCFCVSRAYWIVPDPESMQSGNQIIQIDSKNFKVNTLNVSPLLSNAINRFLSNTFSFQSSGGIPYELTIDVKSNSEELYLGVDESYSLSVLPTKADISANSIYGAMWGLESLSQIVDWNSTQKSFSIGRVPLVVKDKPRFAWRGLLIDTARHFLDLPAIRRQIDALSATKMNTLHWHAVDAESFPIYSATYPALSAKGAYDPSAIYSTDDIKSIVTYAKERGVRVVVEFDVPGHSASWGKGDPSLIVLCPKYDHNINNIPLDPTQEHTYTVLQGFLTEMAALFPDNTIHLGGDEVVTSCWLSNPEITSWMSKHGIKNGIQLIQYFEDNLKTALRSLNKTFVVWQDLFDNGVSIDKSSIIEIWRNKNDIKPIVTAGYRALLSAGWYLALQAPNPQQLHYAFIDTWIDFYLNDPTANLSLSPSQAALVMGGEACMWGENADSNSMDTLIWPRTVAIGERLWSPQNVVDINSATVRFTEHACRLQQRGVHAAPLAPGYCPIPQK